MYVGGHRMEMCSATQGAFLLSSVGGEPFVILERTTRAQGFVTFAHEFGLKELSSVITFGIDCNAGWPLP